MPHGVQQRTFRRETLRIRFRDFFAVLFTASVILGNSLVWLAGGAHSAVTYLLVVPAAVLVLTSGAVLILRRQFTVNLSPEGLRCCDFWGSYHTAAWNGIRGVTVWHLLGLPYLRIESSETRRPLWMSLSLEREADLPEILASFVDVEHPIREAVTSRLMPR